MNISGLVGALLPVFFVLALGYFAGKFNAFDADQAAGLSKLALSFALPASLFVQHDRHPEGPPLTAGASRPGIDSVPCRTLLGRMVQSGIREASARNPFDHLRAHVVDIRHSRIWSSRSQTYSGPC